MDLESVEVKSNPHIQLNLKHVLYAHQNFFKSFPNWLIGKFCQLRTISHPTEALPLEVKLLPNIKVNFKASTNLI